MRECRHKEKVCHSCKKQGHLVRVCRSTKKGNGKRDGKKKRTPPTSQGTHNVEEEDETTGSEDSEDEAN